MNSHTTTDKQVQILLAEARLAAIVESSEDAIIGMTPNGDVTDWNPAAERLYGYTAEEIIGRSIEILLPPNHSEEVPQLLERIRRGERIDHYETARVRKDGRPIHVSLTVSPIRDEAGRVLGVSKVARDITRRKRAEKELGDTLSRIERSWRSQTVMFASTLHDVRGALGTIANYAELLSYAETPQDQAREMALRVATIAHALADVMTDMFQNTREHGRSDVSLVDVSVRDLVLPCAADFRLPCERKGLLLAVDLCSDGTLVTDPSRIARILHNLLGNAVRYTQQGEIRLRADLTSTELRLTVSDTGIGIPPEEIPRVFEELHRTEQARQIEPLGTGLGLATVRQLVGLLGGTLSVISTVGTGSTFEVIVPRNPDVRPPDMNQHCGDAEPHDAPQARLQLRDPHFSDTKSNAMRIT